jgi:thiol:disulfide interchange protein DsbD
MIYSPSMRRKPVRVIKQIAVALLCLSAATMRAAAQDPAQNLVSRFADEHIAVELIAESAAVKPGTRAWLGIKLTHAAHWHTYWMNPGDSGLPTRLEWQLPTGIHAGEIAWPAPWRFEIGGLNNFGYDATVVLPVAIDIAADRKFDASIPFKVNAKWVVCSDDLCIPGKALLQLALPLTHSAPPVDAKVAALFLAARARTPRSMEWPVSLQVTGDKLHIELRASSLPNVATLDAFPTAAKLVGNARPTITRSGERLIVEAQKSDYFDIAPAMLSLVLTDTEHPQAWKVDIPWTTSK